MEELDYLYHHWLPAKELVSQAFQIRKTTLGGDPSGRILVLEKFSTWKVSSFAAFESSRPLVFTLSLPLPLPQKYVTALNSEYKASEFVRFVVVPDHSDGGWKVYHTHPGSSKGGQFTPPEFPEEWLGVRDQELIELTGVEKVVFVYASGHIAGEWSRKKSEGKREMRRPADSCPST